MSGQNLRDGHVLAAIFWEVYYEEIYFLFKNAPGIVNLQLRMQSKRYYVLNIFVAI
jgi:hypothetical protein